MAQPPLQPLEHEAKAKRNEAFVADLEASGLSYEEWRVIATFYGVLHRVDRFLKLRDSTVKQNPGLVCNHPTRRQHLEANHAAIWQLYRPLLEDAWMARYGPELARAKWTPAYFMHQKAVTLPALSKLLQ